MPEALDRRALLARVAVMTAAAFLPRTARALGVRTAVATPLPAPAAGGAAITVYKSRSCGCCTNWVRHMTAAGFVVHAIDSEDVEAVKTQMGIKPEYQSCHTGLVGKYIVEGHVPADLVVRMLREKPEALGLAVPGMPVGSPGMEQGPPEKYEVLLLARGGKSSVYARR